MKGITIRDRDPIRGGLSFDLRDILPLLGVDAERSTWRIRYVECYGGDGATSLNSASDTGEVLAGDRLMHLAREVTQVVDGTFSGRLPGQQTDWIIIRAVDSSAFDVQTDRDDILDRLKTKFTRFEDYPT